MCSNCLVASMRPSGAPADGEAPGCWGAVRTRRTPGRIVKRSGGSNMSASPSTPAGTGLSDDTSNDGGRPLPPRRAEPAGRGRGEHGDAEQAVVDARTGARADHLAQPVGVVGHHDDDRLAIGDVARPLVDQIVVARGRCSDELGHGVEHRLQLRVAIARVLHRLRVEAERHVVHEHPPIDLGQVDATLTTVDKGIERPDDVVTIDAEVEREVVAGARRDTRERQVVLGRDRGHQCLRAVATRSRERVGAPRDGIEHHLPPVVTGVKLDRFDAPLSCLLVEVRRRRFASTGPRVPKHHRPSGRGAAGNATRIRNARRAATVPSHNNTNATNCLCHDPPGHQHRDRCRPKRVPATTTKIVRTRPGRRIPSHNGDKRRPPTTQP